MNNLAKIIIASTALVGSQFAAVSAMAQTAPNGTLTGSVVATKGITLDCELTLTVNSSTNKGSIAMTPGDSLCNALVFNNMPYDTVYSAGVLTFKNVDVTTISLGDCYGDISAAWDGSVLTIDTTLPPKTGGPACVIEGEAS